MPDLLSSARLLRFLPPLTLGALLLGCPTSVDDDDDSAGDPPCGDIRALQRGECGDEGEAELTGVVTTGWSYAYSSGTWRAFAFSLPTSERWGGLYVRMPAEQADQMEIAPGDQLRLQGTFEEVFDRTTLTVETVADIERLGTGLPPAPLMLELTDIAKGGGSYQEPYEGVLGIVGPLVVREGPDEFGAWRTEEDVVVDDFWFEAEWPAELLPGQSIESVTGVVEYSFGEWKLEPVGAGDLILGG